MASLIERPTTPYLNPLYNALFHAPEPSFAIKKLRAYLSESSRFTRNVLVVPPCSLLWAIDTETRQPFWDLIHTSDDFLSSHVLIIPQGSKSGERSRRMQTYNNKTVFVYKNYVQTNAGFKLHYNSKIIRECIYTPASPYFPSDAQFLVYEVEYPLVGRPSYPTLSTITQSEADLAQNNASFGGRGFPSTSNPLNSLTNTQIPFTSSNSTPVNHGLVQQQKDFDNKLLEQPEYFGVDVEKLKQDVRIFRDYKLLPIIYSKDISKIDSELRHLIKAFSVNDVNTHELLVQRYNATIDNAVSIFSAMGATTINKMMLETGLSSSELGQMVGEYVESQIHSKLWEKMQQLFQKKDSKISDLCWAMKNISIEQLGIPIEDMTTLFDLDDLVDQSVKLFSSLTAIIGVSDKTKVLLSVIQILSNGTPTASDKEALQRATKCSVHYNLELNNDRGYSRLKNIMSADILVSLMILVVVRSDMVNVNSLLFYIRNFSFDDTEMGHIGYALSTLEAVAYHIESNHKKMTSLSKLNKKFWTLLNESSQSGSLKTNEGEECDTIEESPAVIEITKCIQHFISKYPEHWISIIRSRSPSGVSALVNCISDIRRQDPEVALELLDFFFDLIDPQTGKPIFDTNFVVGDRDGSGFTLFLLALESEDERFIFSVLSKINELGDDSMSNYFSRVNNWKRNAGHYIFYAHKLIPEIGHLIDWEVKDLAGQTPLFALFRCYDHQSYDELVETSFKAWEKQSLVKRLKSQDSSTVDGKDTLDLMVHRDPKDNTLLHIVKDGKALKMLLQYNVDTNWPNELGFTPLMTYTKYSRLEAIHTILEDGRVDINIQNEGGTTALEIARDPETIKYLESAYLPYVDEKSLQISGYHHSSSVLHTSLSRGRLYFIITSGVPFDPFSLTSVRRTFEDFKFLAKWLGYENPYSWVPPLDTLVGPKILHGKTVYQLFHEVQIRLNVFLRALFMHPTFANHELLWEFVLVQDIEKESVIERCRRKLQNQQEHQMEKEEWWGSSFYRAASSSRASSVSNQDDKKPNSEKKKKYYSDEIDTKKNSGNEKQQSLGASLNSLNDEAAKVFNPIKDVTKKVSLSHLIGGITKSNDSNENLNEQKLKSAISVSSQSEDISSLPKQSNGLSISKPMPISVPPSSSGTHYSLALPKSPTNNSHTGGHSRSVSISSVMSNGSGTSTNGVFFFRSTDLEPIQYFIQYAHDQLSKLAVSAEHMCSGMQRITTAIESCNEAFRLSFEVSGKFSAFSDAFIASFQSSESLPSTTSKKFGLSGPAKPQIDTDYLQKASLFGLLVPVTPYAEFSIGLNALSGIVKSATTTLATPIGLIQQLKEREATLNNLHRTLEKASGKNIWPLGIFEEKRVKDINDVNDKIYLCQNEINRISTDIHRYHETLASEVGALYTIHEEELKRQIGKFVSKIIKDKKTSLQRLQQVQKVVGLPKKSLRKKWADVNNRYLSSGISNSNAFGQSSESLEKHENVENVENDNSTNGSTLNNINSPLDLQSLIANSTSKMTIDQIPDIVEEDEIIPTISVTTHFSEEINEGFQEMNDLKSTEDISTNEMESKDDEETISENQVLPQTSFDSPRDEGHTKK